MKGKQAAFLILGAMVVGGGFGAWRWFQAELAPTEVSPPFYYHLDRPLSLEFTLSQLKRFGVVRDPKAMKLLAWIQRRKETVRSGTYLIQGGLSPDGVFTAITTPIHQKFRFPETNWARRSANLLQRALVCSAKDYLALVNNPSQFSGEVSVPLPTNTLEGYLFPDTYDLPPLTGARPVVERQLRDFENKVVKKVAPDKITEEVLCKASLVELEAGADEDRPMIAGVIENRLKKGIPLQIDAGIEYALGKWRRLYFKDYKDVKSPYNLYLHKGLPPTPICSPSLKSILAVLHPAHHEYLYYVALPNGHTIFAKTPAQHEHNIRLRKLALKQKQGSPLTRLLSATGAATSKSGTKP